MISYSSYDNFSTITTYDNYSTTAVTQLPRVLIKEVLPEIMPFV